MKTQANYSQWVKSIFNHAFPSLASLQVDTITPKELLGVLAPIWHEKPAMARSVRRNIREILAYARVHGHINENVADDRINAGLASQPVQSNHHDSVPYKQIASAFRALDDVPLLPARLALRFIVLTASRSNEALGARWSEMDFDTSTWTIPASRMKNKKVHRVPLSTGALEILEKAKALTDGSDFVFPAPRKKGKAMHPQTVGNQWQKLGIKGKVHGFRNTFGDWAIETGHHKDLADMCLAHQTGNKTQQAYFRTTRFDERKGLMQAWGNYLAMGAQEAL